MRWPEDYSYDEQNRSPTSPRLPFLVETNVTRLQVVLDPALVPREPQGRYLDLLRARSDSGVDFLNISLARHGAVPQGTWRLTFPEADRGYGVEQRVDETRTVKRMRPHLDEFVERYAEERAVDVEEAFQAHAALEAALAAGAHLYVTEKEPLFGWRRDGQMFVCRLKDALAIIGLYQRLRGPLFLLDDLPTRSSSPHAASLAVTALVPELDQLFERGGVEATSWAQTTSMLSSVRVRLERVLLDRDYLIAHHLVAGRRLPYSSAEALVEGIALNLSGAFDSLARALNIALDLKVPPRQ